MRQRWGRERLRVVDANVSASAPRYELRVRASSARYDEFEIWQLPAAAAPHAEAAVRVAGLRGRNLDCVHHHVLKRLANAGVQLRQHRVMALVSDAPAAYAIPEHLALVLGLLFRTIAPMRSRANMIRVAEKIEAMEQDEAAYWLGMAAHRANPRRVLRALRTLLTDAVPRDGER